MFTIHSIIEMTEIEKKINAIYTKLETDNDVNTFHEMWIMMNVHVDHPKVISGLIRMYDGLPQHQETFDKYGIVQYIKDAIDERENNSIVWLNFVLKH
jgi:hypothetical protein